MSTRDSQGQWLTARYLPVGLFSLKPAAATSSGGQTLLVPTPYAIKMALVDAAFRTLGLEAGERLFPSLRDLSIWIDGPEQCVIIKGFGKAHRPIRVTKDDTVKIARAKEVGHYPMQPTIAYREHVQYHGPFQLAFASQGERALPGELAGLLLSINYFGKRGGFMQLTHIPQLGERLTAGFTELTPDGLRPFFREGTLHRLDDCGRTLTLARASTFNREEKVGPQDRIFHDVVLPYRLVRSSADYSWYERLRAV